MSAILGAIEIQMLADVARLRKDMDEAKGVVTSTMGGIANVVKGAMGGLMAGLSVAAFSSWIKGAIDAGDETFNLSQKIGIASKDLAGIQLAFKQAGIESDGMQTAMVALAKNVGNNSEVFKRMGITVSDSKQALYDIADVFKNMPDGIQKTALATELFGKAGANMIPLLNEGSAGMKDMADTAERLGLVISDETAEAADQFNDTIELVGLSSQGVARKVMAELLPTLNNLAGAFLDSVTSGDKLSKVADIIAAALKGLFTVGAIGVEVFNTLGKTLGGVAAAIVSLLQGEFKQSRRILEETGRDITKGWGDTAKTVKAAWSDVGSETVKQASAIVKATNATTVATKGQAEEAKKAAAAQKEAAKAAEAAAKAQQKQEEEAYKALLKYAQERGDVRRAEEKAIADFEASEDARRSKEVQTAQARAEDAKREYDQIGLTRIQIEALTLARLNDKQQAFLAGSANYEAVQKEIDAQKELIHFIGKGDVRQASIKAATDAAAAWNETASQIKQGLTDSLYRAFESGKDFFSTLWKGIVNTFKTTVLRLAIDSVMKPINAGIGGLLGTAAGGAGAATGAAGAASGMLGSIGGTIGTVAPYLAAAAAVYEMFKYKATPHTGSVVSADAAGMATAYGDASGILNNYNASTDEALRALLASSVGTLNALSTAFGGGAEFSGLAKFAADAKDASIGQLFLNKAGQQVGYVGNGTDYAKYTNDPAAALAAFTADIANVTRDALGTIALPEWAAKELASLGAGSSLDQINALAAKLLEEQESLGGAGDALSTSEAAFEPIARSEMLDELRLLRERVDMVTEAIDKLKGTADTSIEVQAQTASYAARTANAIERVMPEGDALTVRVVT
jgi:hypothetical protein